MKYSITLSLGCPHCETKCQFQRITDHPRYCSSDAKCHIAYVCTNCQGIIVTKWIGNVERMSTLKLDAYYPIVGSWKPRVDLSLITNNEVREDFKEAIDCYNNGFDNACMIMARRAIQQEMIINKAKGNNLYEQIEFMEISNKLKGLLHKVKNFGNYGGHPDFFLFDNDGQKINDKKKFAELSLEFLDRYFSDQYEIETLVADSPKSAKELNSDS